MSGDRYAEYYAAKLWQLIPAVYRSLDSEPAEPGPLRELVDRIGVQAAVLRRSVDRLWEDQSIESCDDWIIPYIGDLLATRLVACLDARAQRVDVAKTIYYRRRKGTLGLLEELASDIALHDARVVEFFRRLGRTRHCFDPPIGDVPRPSLDNQLSTARPDQPAAAVIEGLAGAYTRTAMGGYADLRHRYGASKVGSAADEYYYTADLRRGRQSIGWHNIPRLGVFVWWLSTYPVPPTTPIEYKLCPNQFSFDPTGREIALFAATRRSAAKFGESWTSPEEWELPVPISQPLFDLRPDQLYATAENANALAVLEGDTPPYVLMGLDRVAVNVERGRFRLTGSAPAGGQVHALYHYGFSSEIGAGTYDQRRGAPLPTRPDPVVAVQGGASNLSSAAAALGTSGTLAIADSLTYALPAALGVPAGVAKIAVLGDNKQRPVVRSTATAWTINGAANAELVLQGFHLAGPDLLLSGDFASVRIRCATLDPGNSGAALNPPVRYASAVDGQPLRPSHILVSGRVAELTIEQSIAGPIRTVDGGAIETLRVSDSIVQAIVKPAGGNLQAEDIYDADLLATHFSAKSADPLSQFLFGQLSAAGQALVEAHVPRTPPLAALIGQLVKDLNAVLAAPIYTAKRFAQIRLPKALRSQAEKLPPGADPLALNRRLLEAAYPTALANLAIATVSGDVKLTRTTVLGALAVHRLDASECILDDVAMVADAQHGCIRFSAYAEGSVVNQPYESVTVAPAAPLFRTREFGRPDYARLREGADDAVIAGRAGASIVAGAQNGSEMGAFAREQTSLQRRGLAQKFDEFMPVGLVPVWIDAT